MQKSEVADNQQATVSEIEKAWLAGLIDGEGSINCNYPNGKNNSPSPRLTITNTDFELIEKAVSICQRIGGNPHVQEKPRTNPKHSKAKDILILGHSKLLKILPAVMPYLTGRKGEAALALYRFCESRALKGNINKLSNADRLYSEEEISLIFRIKQLNARGYRG